MDLRNICIFGIGGTGGLIGTRMIQGLRKNKAKVFFIGRGAHRDAVAMADTLRAALAEELEHLACLPVPELLENRFQKFMHMGVFADAQAGT